MRSGHKGGMRGIERPKIAAKTQIRRLCQPESRTGDQTMTAVGEVVGLACGKLPAERCSRLKSEKRSGSEGLAQALRDSRPLRFHSRSICQHRSRAAISINV